MLFLFIKKVFDKLPKTIEKQDLVLLYPVCSVLPIGSIMNFIVEPPTDALNTALNNGLAGIGSSSKFLTELVLGGMAPPCTIALATLLFQNKFTKEEREVGSSNFIMEDVILFAASDPLHVFPSYVPCGTCCGNRTFGSTHRCAEKEGCGLKFYTEF